MRDHHLHHHRSQADHGHHRQQHGPVHGKRHGQQRAGRCQQLTNDQPAAIDQVAQRHDQQQTQGIAGLGHAHHQAGVRSAYAEACGHGLQQRLGEVHRGHGQGAGGSQQQRQSAGERWHQQSLQIWFQFKTKKLDF
ncbi:hypothetical protein WR25_24643 [Diploscapter pachys]|uniref:Uncharacterized protein n=1 Tax=Diploscapter pachys TaxID=2018661 RepID=A0A2A2K312_9BILA|nr:hypothetical protein WR25_24643 [Diploscapter pachys]